MSETISNQNGTDLSSIPLKRESNSFNDHLNNDQNSEQNIQPDSPTNSTSNNKRKHDGDHNQTYKRQNQSDNETNDVYFKLLIPSSVAGSVIGRGGERIAQIQKDANVRIKMSKATEFYPNTNERVCLIIGSVRSVLKAHELIVEKIQEKPESNRQQEPDLYERVNQIKLLVPNSTAGLIIGKGGMFIKQIKDDSGAFVQISSKQTDLPERIVSIEGDVEKRNRALDLVIKKIADDPLHNTVPTLNYSQLNSNNSQLNSSISSQSNNDQYNNNNNNPNSSNQSISNKFDFNSIANYLAGLNNLTLLIINCGGSFQMTADNLKVMLRTAGYSSSASNEIIDAITVLLSYGLITKNSPAQLLASNPNIAGLGNMNNITSVIAASLVSTMASMANNGQNNNNNNTNQNSNYNQNSQSYYNNMNGHHHHGHHQQQHHHHHQNGKPNRR